MKKIAGLLILILLIAGMAWGQTITVDFSYNTATDQVVLWVLTDPNAVKYCGHCNIDLGLNASTYCNSYMNEWLQAIYTMNTDPNIPDWEDTHLGKYQQTLTQIDAMDTWAECQGIMKKIIKYLEKQNAKGLSN
jgi:hypothetical protein